MNNAPAADAELEPDRYLVYRLGDKAFASPLLTIKEIVDPLPYCPVPNDHPYFLGLANLRGQIIGVIDLSVRLGLKSSIEPGEGVLLIIEEDGASLGAWVNRVESTIDFKLDDKLDIPLVSNHLPRDSYLGVLRYHDAILPVLSLVQLFRDPDSNYNVEERGNER